jgi:hypothetical protein
MKKLLSIVSALFLVTIATSKAEIGVGITGAYHMIEGDGNETTRQSNEVNKGSHDESVAVPEVFIEMINEDNGFALGVSYIPTRDMSSKSRSDTNTEGDTGTYKAAAELDNVIQVYTDMPLGSIGGGLGYFKLGLQHVTLKTLESLNSGATYPDKDLLGVTVGAGMKGDLGYANMYYKGELTYTNFETYEADGAGNKVNADLEDIAAKISIGYKF